jgi:hypothetical protein
MTTTTDSAHYPGLLPVEPPHEPPPIHPTTLENDQFPNGQPSRRKQALPFPSRVPQVGVAQNPPPAALGQRRAGHASDNRRAECVRSAGSQFITRRKWASV